MSGVSLEKLLFDPLTLEGQQVGSFLISKSGEVIDSTDVSGKKGLDVNVLNELTVDVDLDHTTDSIKIGDGTTLAGVTVANELKVFDATANANLDAIEALLGGNLSVNINSDLPLVYTADSVTAHQGTSPWIVEEAAIESTENSAVSVSDAQVLVTALVGRRLITIQNIGSNDCAIGKTGLTFANGFVLYKGNSITLEIGNAPLYAICASGKTTNLRVLQFA